MVDYFLVVMFYFWVVVLYGSKVEVGIRLIRCYRRCCIIVKIDVYCWVVENDQFCIDVDFVFLYVIGVNVVDFVCQYDWFVIIVQFFVVVVVYFFFISMEVVVQCWMIKFVVKCCVVQWVFGYDVQCGDNVFRFIEIFFLWLFEVRNLQVGNGEINQICFWFCVVFGGIFIVDFIVGIGCCVWLWRNCCWVVVSFDFYQNMCWFLMEIVVVCFVVSKVVVYFRIFYYGGVIFISRENVIWCGFESIFDYFEQ